LLRGSPLEKSRAFVLDNIQQGYPHFVAILDGKVIGWCDICPSSRSLFKHSGSLGIGVIAGFRGQGIGESLMRTALDQAKQIGLTRVELTVREHNMSALNLYKKLGFVIEGVKRKGAKLDGVYEDVIMMAVLFE
jgi:ribosomal protein S18 acetylase RimI-like enzyme